MSLRLDYVGYQAAKYAVDHWHYSEKMPVGKSIKIGIWEDEQFIGAIIFSMGNTPLIGNFLGLEQTEICELTRIAMNHHIVPVSRAIAIALKLLRKRSPGIKAVVSFADQEQEHLGKIYQAANWIYVGKTQFNPVWIYEDKRIHNRAITVMGGTGAFGKKRRTKVDMSKIRRIRTIPKHKYVWPFTKEIRTKLEEMRKPYPKELDCPGSVNGSTPSYQESSGGSSPTSGLENRGGAG